jgi:tripartite ATP-independent transporter DctM subunit
MDGWLGLGMFLLLMMLIFSGFPVAYILGGVTIIASTVGILAGEFNFIFLQTIPSRIYGIMQNYMLLAIPFFIFMGLVMQKSKIADDLLVTSGMLFGRVKGGIAIAVILIGGILAASTGVIGATIVAMGLISLPVMLRYEYDDSPATGVIIAAGSLGQIMPPSIVLIVLGDQMGVSINDLFVAALFPAALLVILYILYVLVLGWFKPESMPRIPAEDSTGISIYRIAFSIIKILVPPLALIISVLGSIFYGFATPTEAGAVGAVGALLLSMANKRFNIKLLKSSLEETSRITSMIMIILVGATAFAIVFKALDGDWLIRDIFAAIPGGQVGFIIVSLFLIFILGFFIDFFEIIFIVIPIILPAAIFMDIDLLWYAILVALVVQTSFLTPPFGFALFYLRSVSPSSVLTSTIYKGAIPFICLQVLAILIVYFFPSVVLWLPSLR